MARHPQLIVFDVTEAMSKQAQAIEELAKTVPAKDLEPIVEATGQLVKAWRDYQQALDPEGYAAAVTELEQSGTPADLPFLRGGSKT